MYVRFGFYEGRVEPARQTEFDEHFQRVVIPGLARMPGIVSVRLLRGVPQGTIQPRFHHAIELTATDEGALLDAMRSQERRALQAGPWDVMKFYEGATPHANFRVTADLPGAQPEGASPSSMSVRGKLTGMARVGAPGMEKPVAVYEDGEIRDVSVLVSEVDRSFISADWARSVEQLDPARVPWVDNRARRGACLEYRNRIIALDIDPAEEGGPLRAALRAGSLAGANDELVAPAGFELDCTAGVAAVIGATGGKPRIAGICLFVAASPAGNEADEQSLASLVASAPGLISLGPLLVEPRRWAERPAPVALFVNDRLVDEVEIGLDRIVSAVGRLNEKAPLEIGDLVLCGRFDGDANASVKRCVSRGSVVEVAGGILGSQRRACR